MSSPSPTKPFDIPSPRQQNPLNAEGTPPTFGTPNLGISASPSPRFLRAQYNGTPPPPNIPPRSNATPIGTPRAPLNYLPSLAGEPSSYSSRGLVGLPGSRPSGVAQPGALVDNPFDDLTDEEKARVLRKHLVSREERQTNAAGPSDPVPAASSRAESESGNLSKRSSFSQYRVQREDTEPFPVPYDAPGADIT